MKLLVFKKLVQWSDCEKKMSEKCQLKGEQNCKSVLTFGHTMGVRLSDQQASVISVC